MGLGRGQKEGEESAVLERYPERRFLGAARLCGTEGEGWRERKRGRAGGREAAEAAVYFL